MRGNDLSDVIVDAEAALSGDTAAAAAGRIAAAELAAMQADLRDVLFVNAVRLEL